MMPLRQAIRRITIATAGKGLTDFSGAVADAVRDESFASGLATLFCRHTSASLLIQENADPDVRSDIAAYFERMAPEGDDYIHDSEGPDDMPAHLRAALTAVQVAVPIVDGRLALGTWQGIFLFEHRRAPHRREVVLHILGE